MTEADALRAERQTLQAVGTQCREVEWLEQREAELRDAIWEMDVAASTETVEDILNVREEDVAAVVSSWTGIPVARVGTDESQRLLNLEAELHKRIIGQDEAVRTVAKALRRSRAGLRDPRRPIAGLIFCGPTGVGKTALCKVLATTCYGSEDAMIRLDMSEFAEKHTESKLIGAPPGYVGYVEGGALTEAIRRRPYSLVLFDEVEKAHPDVFNLMLQLLDDGRLTDARGRTVSFANALVVMTSNVGSRSVERGVTGGGVLGFGTGTPNSDQRESYSYVQQLVQEELKGIFRPEFLNRVDEVVVFQALRRQDVREIAEVEFAKVVARLNDVGFSVTLTEAFKEKVVSEGFFPAYGARPLRRAITRLLEDPLSEHVLGLHLNAGQGGSSSSSSSELPMTNTSREHGSDGEFPDSVPPIGEQRPDNEAYHFEEDIAAAATEADHIEDSIAAATEGYYSDDITAALSEADVTTENDEAHETDDRTAAAAVGADHSETAAAEGYYSDDSTAALSKADVTTENDKAHEIEDSTAAAAVEAYHSEIAAAEDFYNEELATESVYVEAIDTTDSTDASGTELTDSSQAVKEEESEPVVAEHTQILLDGDISASKAHHADPELKVLLVDVDVSGEVFVKSS